MPSGIYQIINSVNGNRYIGSAVNLRKRWRQHQNALRRGQHDNQHLQRAFKKYGEPAFTFEVLEEVSAKNLISREQTYLDVLLPEYNIAPTAGSCFGRPCSLETRRKMSETLKGHSVSESTRGKIAEARRGTYANKETCEKISRAMSGEGNPNYGKHHSDETRRKISEARRGQYHSKETRKRMSEAHKGKIFNEEHRRKLSEAAKGRTFSEETRAKISESHKARWRRIRASNARANLKGGAMKLSEPQKRVLRVMYASDCLVYVREHGHRYYCWHSKRPDPCLHPHIRSLAALEHRGLLSRIDRCHLGAYDLCLTPKGREKAKELQDAETE